MALREAVEAAVNIATEAQEAKEPVTPAEKVEPQVEAKEVSVTPEPVEKSSRTEGRPRDDKGRLLPGKAEKVDAPKPELKVEAEPVAAPPKPKTPPPSSWKKETWEHWEKADPNLQAYIAQRESEFAKGVSTYKQDFDRVKPLADVVSQYEPFLKQHNMAPHQAVDALFKNDQTLRFGTQQQKLQTFAKLATDYQIPLHEMLVQGEDGKVYLNQQYFQPQQQQAPQYVPPPEPVRNFMVENQWFSAVQLDDAGNPIKGQNGQFMQNPNYDEDMHDEAMTEHRRIQRDMRLGHLPKDFLETPEYFERIKTRVAQTFPDAFEGEEEQTPAPRPRTPPMAPSRQPVAPTQRQSQPGTPAKNGSKMKLDGEQADFVRRLVDNNTMVYPRNHPDATKRGQRMSYDDAYVEYAKKLQSDPGSQQNR